MDRRLVLAFTEETEDLGGLKQAGERAALKAHMLAKEADHVDLHGFSRMAAAGDDSARLGQRPGRAQGEMSNLLRANA